MLLNIYHMQGVFCGGGALPINYEKSSE